MKEAVRFVTVHLLDGKQRVDLPFWGWKLSSSIEQDALPFSRRYCIVSLSFPSYEGKALSWCLNYRPKLSTRG